MLFTGKLRLDLKLYHEAAQIYRDLLQINPENTTYYLKLAEAERHENDRDTLLMLQEYEEKFPRALAPRRLQLNYATKEEFKALVDQYLRRGKSSFFTIQFFKIANMIQLNVIFVICRSPQRSAPIVCESPILIHKEG